MRQKLNGYFRSKSDRMNRRRPHTEASVHPMVCCFLLTVGATATRFGGLYIRLTQAILSLLELLDIPHTPKNTSKPFKSIKIKFLVLSTSFASVSARLALE